MSWAGVTGILSVFVSTGQLNPRKFHLTSHVNSPPIVTMAQRVFHHSSGLNIRSLLQGHAPLSADRQPPLSGDR